MKKKDIINNLENCIKQIKMNGETIVFLASFIDLIDQRLNNKITLKLYNKKAEKLCKNFIKK